MDDSKPKVNYQYAHLMLNPEKYFCNVEWQEKFLRGQFDDSKGVLDLLIGDCVLEMGGITIPVSRIKNLSSERAVVDSVKRLVGKFGESINRCIELSDKGEIQNSLYFTQEGLCDYSETENLGGIHITDWIVQARDYSSDLRSYFPEDVMLPPDLKIEFVQTFQALRDLGNFVTGREDVNMIKGATFSECVNNFIRMYDAVTEHISWVKGKEREKFQRRYCNSSGPFMHEGKVPVASLVLTDS